MSRKPQLIICDVDGTLIDRTEAITPYFDELARLLEEHQLRFTLASGRCYDHLRHYVEKLRIQEPVIINNGGGARVNGTALWDEMFPATLVKDAILKANEMDMAIFMCDGDDELAYRHNAYIQRDIDMFGRYNRFYIPLPGDWETLHFEKLMITDPDSPGRVDEVLELLLPHQDVLNIYRYDDRHLDIVKKGISKGGAVLRLAGTLGVHPDDILAIGDSLNDAELFQTAGLRAAVGNAKDALKAQADYVCTATHTAGVIEAVRHFCARERM